MANRLTLLKLARASLLNRRGTAALTLVSIAISVALVIGVNTLRNETRISFTNTLSGTDLIVGPRTGPLNLLLYAVFRIGDANTGLQWHSYEALAAHADVEWAVPLALGDSHRGFRVLGTTLAYFTHYQYGRQRALQFDRGAVFAGPFDAVLGAEVAAALNYRVGDAIVIAHGIGAISFKHHDQQPFRVVGVLARTGTPVDATVHISMAGLASIHADDAAPPASVIPAVSTPRTPGTTPTPKTQLSPTQLSPTQLSPTQQGRPHGPHGHADDDHVSETSRTAAPTRQHDAEPATEQLDDGAHGAHPSRLTAVLVGLTGKLKIFSVQRFVNEYANEPLLAIVPGVTLQQLWSLLGIAETALFSVSVFVVVAGLIGLLTTLLTSLAERRREMAVLRSLGARPSLITGLLVVEAGLLGLLGALLGVGLSHLLMTLARPWLLAEFGLYLTGTSAGLFDLLVIAGVTVTAMAFALIPGWRAYRFSLADGLTIRT